MSFYKYKNVSFCINRIEYKTTPAKQYTAGMINFDRLYGKDIETCILRAKKYIDKWLKTHEIQHESQYLTKDGKHMHHRLNTGELIILPINEQFNLNTFLSGGYPCNDIIIE